MINLKSYNQFAFTFTHYILNRKKPFAAIRLGDGEYRILCGYFTGQVKYIRERFDRWFTTKNISDNTLMLWAEEIFKSYDVADFIGLPNADECKYPKWVGLERMIHKLYTGTPMLTDFHNFIYYPYHQLFKELSEAAFLTCRDDLREILKQKYPHLATRFFLIPPEVFTYCARYNKHVNNIQRSHSELMGEIQVWIKQVASVNCPLFVSAGGLGKTYCSLAKQYGGTGIDVGALMDGWCGLPTRPYLQRNLQRYAI